jgi:GH24 family phage-related lysozyme (muramidase)
MTQEITSALLQLLSKADLLIVFIGMLMLVRTNQNILQNVVQDLTRLLGGQPLPPPAPVAQSKPVSSWIPGVNIHPEIKTITAGVIPQSASPIVTPSIDTLIVDPGLVAYVKSVEGFSTKAFWDYKQYSIGYGTRANSSTEVIDEAEATRRLTVEINAAEKLVEAFAPNASKGLKQALTDLTYNVGTGWEQGSLGAAVKAGKIDTIKADILLFDHAGGEVNAGLTKRRQAEVSWIDNPL